jgi:hypothetical protein
MFALTDIQQTGTNIFDCISLKTEYSIPVKNTEVIDYMVTVFPREEKISGFQFVYGLFNQSPVAFSQNQHLVLGVANELFANSSPLDHFEQKVLNNTFNRTVKKQSTLPGRK